MKKTVSLMLTLALGLSMASPAFAAEASVDQQLSQVTSKVKTTLGIGDEYTEFNGQTTNNGVFNRWDLNWNSESKSLMVEADESGKVMSYYLNAKDESYNNKLNLPTFPKTGRAAAKSTAEAFVKKVLGSGESLKWDTDSDSTASTSQHSFSGDLLLNGLPSPITFSVTVQADKNQVIRFRRSDLYDGYVGSVPDAKPTAQQNAAAQLLKGSLKLKTEYVLDNQNGKNKQDDKNAVLRFIPDGSDEYYVDAQTGKLVNLTERYKEISEEGSYLYRENAAAADMAASGGSANGKGDSGEAEKQLSKAEEDGIAKLAGVLSQAEIDKKLRSIAALGLSGQEITSFNYYVDEDDVNASIHYALKADPEKRNTNISVDARTGEIIYLQGWVPYDENRKATVTEEKAKQNAESFLKELWPTQFSELELYASDTENYIHSGIYTFNYARKVNGYFFPESSFNVGIDVEDGTVRRLIWDFDEEVKFQSADGIISDADALDKWFGSYAATLGYISVPVALNPSNPQHKYLIAEGQKYYNGLGLAYYLDREEDYSGVDAKTGELALAPKYESEVIEYSDLDSTWAKQQMETLIEYGIGYPGGELLPTQEVTQIDFISLLATTNGYYYHAEEKDAADDLYRYAYNMGIITSAQRNDNAKLTRIDAIKILLDYIGYGEVAKLENIFRSTFTDEASIPADSYGYAAIAQGMGLVSGDTNGKLDATRTATRVEAAMMVYNYMNR